MFRRASIAVVTGSSLFLAGPAAAQQGKEMIEALERIDGSDMTLNEVVELSVLPGHLMNDAPARDRSRRAIGQREERSRAVAPAVTQSTQN